VRERGREIERQTGRAGGIEKELHSNLLRELEGLCGAVCLCDEGM
jgi:hypothetical protein